MNRPGLSKNHTKFHQSFKINAHEADKNEGRWCYDLEDSDVGGKKGVEMSTSTEERQPRRSRDEADFNSHHSAKIQHINFFSPEYLLSDVESQETKDYQNRVSYDRSRNLRPIGLIFTLLFLLFLSISSIQRLSSSRNINYGPGHGSWGLDDFENIAQKRTLGITLHPQNHEYRPAKTITHSWVITSGHRSPDGVRKRVYLVNGEFPGPTIECRSGDRLIIHVKNELESEGVSIHWHGLSMRKANSMDGAVGITQCPIRQGKSFTYDFEVDENQSGTFWWHAHSEVQRGDGMYGGLVVHEPIEKGHEIEKIGYEEDVLLLIGDWYHRTGDEVLEWYMGPRGFGNEVRPVIFLFVKTRLQSIACAGFLVNQWSRALQLFDGRPSKTS